MSLLLDRESSESTAANRWAQSLVRVAFLPAVIAAAVCVVAVFVTLLTAGSTLTGAFGAVGAVWLALHQVPVSIGGTDLGALPLLPTLVLMMGVARCAYRFTAPDATPTRQAQIVAAAAGGPLVITVVALALISDASATFGLYGPAPVITVGGVIAVNGVAAILGVGAKTMWANATRWGVPTWMLTSLRAGVIAGLAVFSVGALLVSAGVLIAWTDIAESIGAEPTVVGQVGLLVLSVLYLPNVMVAAAAVLTGASAHIGQAGYSLFLVEPGPAPAVPILKILPQGELAGWLPALLAVCAAIGLWLGWRYREVGETVLDMVRFHISVGAVAAMIALGLGFMAGGQMGSFGFLGVDAPIFALYLFGWITAPGLLAAVVNMGMGHRRPFTAGHGDHGDHDDHDGYDYDDHEDSHARAAGQQVAVVAADYGFRGFPDGSDPTPDPRDEDFADVRWPGESASDAESAAADPPDADTQDEPDAADDDEEPSGVEDTATPQP